MKRIIVLRTNKVDPDPRVEKEVSSLIKCKDLNVEVNAWDRDGKYNWKKERLILQNGAVIIHRIGIPGTWGKGMKSNLFPSIKYEIRLFFWLIKHCKEYDYIHACDLMTGLPALLPTKLFRKKFVYDCVDYYSDSQTGPKFVLKILKKLETIVINKADITILCSEKRINQIIPAKPKKIVYIHNSPNMDQFSIKKVDNGVCKSKSNKIKITYVGNFCENRWLIQFLNNSSKLKNIMEVHIGGFGGLEDKIKEIVNENENMFYYGKMKYSDVLQLESETDCIVALYETNIKNHIYAAPNKFYEALALGKPLLMIKNSGMSEIVEEKNFGATFMPNFESFSQAINRIIELKKKEHSLSKREMDYFKKNYDWKIMEKRLIDIYHNK